MTLRTRKSILRGLMVVTAVFSLVLSDVIRVRAFCPVGQENYEKGVQLKNQKKSGTISKEDYEKEKKELDKSVKKSTRQYNLEALQNGRKKLQELEERYQRGEITKEEYEKEKARLEAYIAGLEKWFKDNPDPEGGPPPAPVPSGNPSISTSGIRRPPAGTGLEPLIFNPANTVLSWETWWARNRLNYLPFKEPINWAASAVQTSDDQTIAVKSKPEAKKARETLVQALKEEDNPFIQATAALALGKYREKSALAPLQEILKNGKDFDARNVASLSLGIIGDESVVGDLRKIIFNETNKGRMISQAYAALALGYIKTNASIGVLKEILDSKNNFHPEIECSAVLSLGNIQEKSLVPFLGDILNDSRRDDNVRAYAALALGRITDPSALPYLKKALPSTLNLKTSAIRASIAISMGLIPSPESRNELVNLLTNDKSPETRSFAAISLAQLKGDKSIYQILSNQAQKNDVMAQGMIILSLGLLGDENAVPELQKIVEKKTKPRDRGAAILALGLLKDKSSLPLLIKIVEKEEAADPVAWTYAIQSLGMIGDPSALPALEKTFEKVQKRLDLAASAYNNLTVALAMLGKRKEVLTILHDQINDKSLNPELKTRVIRGLGYLGDENSIEPLIKLYQEDKNDNLRLYAVMALGFILDKERINPLYKITADNNFNIRLIIMDHIFFSKPD